MHKALIVFRRLLIVLFLFVVLALGVHNYSFLFSRTVKGVVVEINKVSPPAAVTGGAPLLPSQFFSAAVAIKEDSGEIFTASSEDRQWSVVKKGYCVEAVFYPYPPWILEKGGTYFNARLKRMRECGDSGEATSN